MRVFVVTAAVVAAASLSTSRCHAGSATLPGYDDGIRTPGLSTDLPGSHLAGLPSSLTHASNQSATERDPMPSGAMLKLLKDPSLLSAAPGSPARAAMQAGPPSPAGRLEVSETPSSVGRAADRAGTLPASGTVAPSLLHSPAGSDVSSGDRRAAPSAMPGARG